MENLGLNNDVLVGGKKFHVQTNYSESRNAFVANIFLDGAVIDSKEAAYEVSDDNQNMEEALRVVHQELITEMEILYYINEKVSSVRHAASANKLGLLFLSKNLIDEAISQFKLAQSVDPSLSEVFANLGRAYLLNNVFEEAVAILSEGSEKAPDFTDIQNYLGIAYLYKKENKLASIHLQKAIDLNPDYIGAHYHLGIALLARSLESDGTDDALKEEALGFLNLAEKSKATHKIHNFHKVMEKVNEGEFEKAVNEFLEGNPKEALPHFENIENEFYLKFMYGGKGKDVSFIAEYVSKLKESIDEHPEYADVHNNLGVANLIQCRNLFLKAIEEFHTALKINPNFKKAEKNLKLAENDGKGFLILLRAILK